MVKINALDVKTSPKKLFFVDFLKAISITAVVSYHSIFVPIYPDESSYMILDVLFAPLRFCVPVLLTLSFLLSERGFAKKPHQSITSSLRKRLTRLSIPTLFWVIVASSLKLLTGNSLTDIVPQILQGEIFTGFYYLLVIFQLTILFFFIRRLTINKNNLSGLIGLQTIIFLLIQLALYSERYSGVTLVLRSIDRPLIIYWFIYLILGIFIYRNLNYLSYLSEKTNLPIKLLLISTYAFACFLENGWLFKITEGDIPPFDYVMFSCILSVPVIFICCVNLTEEQFSPRLKNIISLLSKYSLGIFCFNGIISQVFLSFGTKLFSETIFNFPELLIMKLLGWIGLLAISLGLSMLFNRLGLKNVVC